MLYVVSSANLTFDDVNAIKVRQLTTACISYTMLVIYQVFEPTLNCIELLGIILHSVSLKLYKGVYILRFVSLLPVKMSAGFLHI